MILDEAQRIKNWQTRAARSVKGIASRHAIVLTGTPLENRLEELVSIVEFVDRHRLGPTYRFLRRHQVVEGEHRARRRLSRPRQGRRGARADLAAATEVRGAARASKAHREEPLRADDARAARAPRRERGDGRTHRPQVAQAALPLRGETSFACGSRCQNMRMSCDSTFLLDHKTDSGAKVGEIVTLLGDILEEPGVKVVIFSQWLGMHELIARKLAQRGWDHVRFYGSLDQDARRAAVDRFRDEPALPDLLSTDAGGVGLNLQHARCVFERGPAVEPRRPRAAASAACTASARPARCASSTSSRRGRSARDPLPPWLQALGPLGVLDDGAKEVFLGGTRLTQFMETVSKATENVVRVAGNETARTQALRTPKRPQVETPRRPRRMARERDRRGPRPAPGRAPEAHAGGSARYAGPRPDAATRSWRIDAEGPRPALEGQTRSDGASEARDSRPLAAVRSGGTARCS